MGDLVAILDQGRLVQFDRPDRLLASPKTEFVADFVGADRALKALALVSAGEAANPEPAPPDSPSVGAEASLREALAVMLARHADLVAVIDAKGSPIGSLTLAEIRSRAAPPA